MTSNAEHDAASTRAGRVSLRSDGILRVRMHPVDHDQDSARELLAATRELLRGAVVPVLVDMRDTGSIDRGARSVFATEADFARAQALLVASAFTRIMANLFLRVGSPSQPARMFTDEVHATRWLRGFLR